MPAANGQQPKLFTVFIKGGVIMAMQEKEAVVTDIKQKFEKSKTVVLADYRGLTVGEVTELRKKMREAGIDYKVLKNTMTSRAAKAANIEGLDQYLSGPTAVAFSYNDYAAPAKILAEFAKNHKKLELKAGVLDGKVIDFESVKNLAELPSREVLLGMVAGMLQAPVRGLVTVLAGPLRNFVCAVEAIRKQKAGE
jgi:large subunit ribosomal protein L10